MSFWSDVFESIRGNCRQCMSAPLSRQKLFILGGVLLFLIILIIILIGTLSSGGGESPSQPKGSEALKDVALVVGNNQIAFQLKTQYLNQINDANFSKISEDSNITALKKGLIGVQVWSIGVNCTASQYHDSVAQVLEQIDVMKRYAEKMNLKIVTDVKSILNARPSEVIGLLALDGGYVLDSRASLLRIYYALGIRILRIGGCPGPWNQKENFDEYGKDLVGEMNRLGMIIDLTGSSPEVQKTILSVSNAPVIFSSSNVYTKVNHPLNLNESILAEVRKQNALVMISFNAKQLCSFAYCNITSAVDMINELITLIGINKVGIGGGFGEIGQKYALKDPSEVLGLFDALYQSPVHHLSFGQLKNIANFNFIDIFSKIEKTAIQMKAKNQKPLEKFQPEKNFPTGTETCYTDFKLRYNKQPEPPKPPVMTEKPTAEKADDKPNAEPKDKEKTDKEKKPGEK